MYNQCISRFLAKTIEATMMKKAPNESKLIYAINIFLVVSLCLLISLGSHLNTQIKNVIFSATLTLRQ